MIDLSKRLEAIVHWVHGHALADIGCDHAYVAVSSILLNKVDKAYACDIAQGPLENAIKTIETYHLQEKVFPFLTNGMQQLPKEVDIVVIAGMGAKTIEMILDEGDLENREFLLMPHKDSEDLRVYCQNHSLRILKERMIYEDNHYYPLMDVIYDKDFNDSYSKSEILYGVSMIQDETYFNYLQKEYIKWKAIASNMPKDKKTKALYRLEILKKLQNSLIKD